MLGFCPQLDTTTHKFTQTKTNKVTMTAHVCLMMQKEPEVTQNRDSRRSTEEKNHSYTIASYHINDVNIVVFNCVDLTKTIQLDTGEKSREGGCAGGLTLNSWYGGTTLWMQS